ncbi:hypothetical protein [Allonocardiopsis opalescens]|uniref:Secreted protein n=1 Tax=Allonocardiopsis opalescens TaxID=1144618 RepID=A0A2T0Q0K6_9ACTN|nr:hypothetical protein [Allonocardiopsis opalescens]PRX97318.1 hypothetical protein CLV72_106355 [Allonocardiopsis opalescens]
MTRPVQITLFVLAGVAVFAAALLAGRLVGPMLGPDTDAAASPVQASPPPGHAGHAAPAAELPHLDTVEVDGYTVSLAGDPVLGGATLLVATITRDGEPVTDLESYEGVTGPVAADARGTDPEGLDGLNIHMMDVASGVGTTETGPSIAFHASPPEPGEHRLFVDFRHRGEEHTAEFDVLYERIAVP